MPDNFNYLNPDFEAEMRLPEWMQLGGEQSMPDVGPLASALKKRMTKPPDPNAVSTMMSGSMGSGSSSGGMKSL
jgi:hypothetical protein